MSHQTYHVLHLVGLFMLVALTHRMLVVSAAGNKKPLIVASVAALVAIVAGFGLMAKFQYSFTGWLGIKIACGLVLAAVPFLALRCPEKAKLWSLVVTLALVIAVYAVYFRPFA